MRWIVLVCVLVARVAVAGVGDADAVFEQGRAKLAANDFRGACQLFERANELDHDAPGTLLNLGLCHEKLGELATAVRWYRKAESYAQRKSMPKVEAAARDRIVELAPKLPTLRLVLAPGADDVAVAIDRAPVDRSEYEQLAVDPGHHVLAISAPGKQPRELPIDARPGGEQVITIDPLVAPPMHVHSNRKTLGLWIGGVGGGLLVGQAIIGFGGRIAGETNTGTWHTFTRYGLFTAGVVGGVGLVVGAALYVTAPRERAVTPIVAPDRVGIAYGGAF